MRLRCLVLPLAACAALGAATGEPTSTPSGNPMLGVGMRPPPINVIQQNNLGPNQGVYVREVFDGTAAQDMGIRPGDVILRVNDTAIANMSDLRGEVERSQVGDNVSVVVRRNGEDLTLGSSFRQWPKDVPRREIDAAAERRYRDMLEQRIDRQQQAVEDVRRDNEQLERQAADLERQGAGGGTDPLGGILPADRPSIANPGIAPSDLKALPAAILRLPAWRFGFACAVDGKPTPEANARAAVPTAPSVIPPPALAIGFSCRIAGEAL